MFRKKTTAYASTLLATLLALGLSAPASAQDDDGFVDRISGIMQLDVTNAYFFRGILQEREGVQIQPWTELYFNLFSAEDGFIRDVTIGGGLWTSFQSERTLATEEPPVVLRGRLLPAPLDRLCRGREPHHHLLLVRQPERRLGRDRAGAQPQAGVGRQRGVRSLVDASPG